MVKKSYCHNVQMSELLYHYLNSDLWFVGLTVAGSSLFFWCTLVQVNTRLLSGSAGGHMLSSTAQNTLIIPDFNIQLCFNVSVQFFGAIFVVFSLLTLSVSFLSW